MNSREQHDLIARTFFAMFLGSILVLVISFIFAIQMAWAHDEGQWGNSDPKVREWYRSLMQPDNPKSPCCGEADSYWADEVHVRDGKTYATITDDRDDKPLRRPHVPNGTEIEIPNHKMKWDAGNPTGHNLLFMSYSGWVYCFVQSGGA